jgi:peptide/nickel transport system substrate-binding protein
MRVSWRGMLMLAALAATVAACGGSSKSGSTAKSSGPAKRGESPTIARIEDSQSFDKTNVFQNESIWLTEQINEPLYTVAEDGKTLKPWLATSYTKAADGLTYTFKLRPDVKFSTGKVMTSADVKFSIDDARLAPDRHRPVHVGQARRRQVRHLQAQPVLLAEGKAVPCTA